jgi:ferredoxin
VRAAEVSGHLEAQAVDAAQNCPEDAVSLSP